MVKGRTGESSLCNVHMHIGADLSEILGGPRPPNDI